MRLFKIRCSAIGQIMSNAKVKGELSAGCKTYLENWYANDKEDIHSKYFDKGNMVEIECIDLMASVLDKGIAFKNDEHKEDEYFTGTCDVQLDDTIVDVKSVWGRKGLHAACNGLDKDYEWQLQGYAHLYNKDNCILFYGLCDTPEECNFGNEVIYSDMPLNERWVAYSFKKDENKINDIIEKVKQCRIYLEVYDKIMKNKLGKINN
jgi:hypothetical protein